MGQCELEVSHRVCFVGTLVVVWRSLDEMDDYDGSAQLGALDSVRWTMTKDGGRMAQCRVVRHPLGFELRVDIDGDTRVRQVHRQEADADIHAAELEDRFIEKGWS